jgi:putative ABC transport system permease protein
MRLSIRKLLQRTPFAWLQLSNNPTKMLIGIAGVGFSNLLMFFQLGLMDSLYNSQAKPIEKLHADLVMVSSKYSRLGSLQDFPRSRLFRLMGVDGVEAVSTLRVGRATWITPATRQSFDLFVYGVNLTQPSLDFAEIDSNRSQLQILGNALFDRNTSSRFGNVLQTLEQGKPFNVEINNRRTNIIGTFPMGATFVADANLITANNTFLHLFPRMDPNQIQLGLIRLRPGAAPQTVKAAMEPLLNGRNVMVVTRQELAMKEMNYWKRNSSVGFIFSIGVVVGFLVGSIIVYQILYSDVMNSLPQYATLKAMGYRDPFVIGIVIQQSAILALVGFIPGVVISCGLYFILAEVTRLAVVMTVNRALMVLMLTFIMCVSSGTLATRKLVQLDPADVF